MTGWQRPITATIDVINLWIGRLICLILVPIIGVMVSELRVAKMFVAPTLRGYDVSRILAGALLMLGAG